MTRPKPSDEAGRDAAEGPLDDPELPTVLLDGYPALVLLVDPEARVLFMNRAARESLAPEGGAERALFTRTCNLLDCVGAGPSAHGPGCGECVIRGSIAKGHAKGAVHRARAVLRRHVDGRTVDAHFLVSAAPIRYRGRTVALLTLEDLGDIASLAGLIPVCASCRAIRNGEGRWQRMETYFREQADLQFSHGLCEECLDRLYPEDAPADGPPGAPGPGDRGR